jgi:hypothetical protein
VTTLLAFAGVLAGIVLLAFVVSRITGARCHYLDAWTPDPGEHILFDDRKVRIVITLQRRRGNAIYPRKTDLIHPRAFTLVTDRRIVAGQRPLFSKRFLIEYMIFPGDRSDRDARKIGGGVLARGYTSYAIVPGSIRRVANESQPFVELTLSTDAASPVILETIRIYTDRAASFPMPVG